MMDTMILMVIHHRKIKMSSNGNLVSGLDTIKSESINQRKVFDNWIKSKNEKFIPFSAQFHIAPNIEINLSDDNKKVTLKTLRGVIWTFEALNGEISIQDSAFMQFGELNPRAAKQIVVTSAAIDYEGAIEWTLSK